MLEWRPKVLLFFSLFHYPTVISRGSIKTRSSDTEIGTSIGNKEKNKVLFI
jgi:hypothetical protein